jgi:hypothetical protein
MALDYILAHREDRFLPTEHERVAHFVNLGLDRARLPHVTYRSHRDAPPTDRYFVEKYPMSVHDTADTSLVSIAYIDPGDYSVDGFETFLRRYTALIAGLPHVRLVYVADAIRNVDTARARWESWRRTSIDTRFISSDATNVRAMVQWFEAHQLVETNRLAELSVARIRAYRDGRERFQTNEGQQLYQIWQDTGEVGVRQWLAHARLSQPPPIVEFATYRLSHDYSALRAPTYNR